MSLSTFILAIVSSLATVIYLVRGIYINQHQFKDEEYINPDIKARVRVLVLYPDHSLYTVFLLAMAATLKIDSNAFVLFCGYFAAVKYTEAFGLLKEENEVPENQRHLGTMLILLPMIILPFYNLYKALYLYF